MSATAGRVDANAESARGFVRAADVTLARVEAIHAKIEDAYANIFQATLESSKQPTSKKVVEAMEYELPCEIAQRELEMQEAMEIEKCREEELHVAEDEVEKSPSVE
ncbi:hypothetical protein ZWY2020_021075 [Hordeum vulgare]|nr:hypothetical protein ZWY2020_021075 [Hordeum vulgare]